MKINILVECLFLRLVHPPAILVLVSPSDFTWVEEDGDSLDVQSAPGAGHTTNHSTSKKKRQIISAGIYPYMHENTALIMVWFVASKCSAWLHLQGRRLKTGQNGCHSQEKVPKQKELLPRLCSSQVCSPSLFFYNCLPHFLCCSLSHLLGFSPPRFLVPQTSKSIANCWAFPYHMDIKVRKNTVMKTE